MCIHVLLVYYHTPAAKEMENLMSEPARRSRTALDLTYRGQAIRKRRSAPRASNDPPERGWVARG